MDVYARFRARRAGTNLTVRRATDRFPDLVGRLNWDYVLEHSDRNDWEAVEIKSRVVATTKGTALGPEVDMGRGRRSSRALVTPSMGRTPLWARLRRYLTYIRHGRSEINEKG